MRRSFIMLLCLFIIISVTSCRPQTVTDTSKQEPAADTPRIFLLTVEDPMLVMPSITLYENGNARLSQPAISSFARFELGKYAVDGSTLTVSYDDGSTAIFTMSDNKETLTLTATNVGFTKIGAVYQYQSRTEYLDQYSRIDGEALTLEAVRELASKTQTLTYADLKKYAHYKISTDDYTYDIEGLYTMNVTDSREGDTSIIVENNTSGERFPLHLNGSTGLVFDEYLGIMTVPAYQASQWLDYYLDENLPWEDSIDLTIPEYPGVTFTWTADKVIANGVDLFYGMPVWNVFLSDLTNDGKPELCATVSIGSGIVSTHVIVYDYTTGQEYQMAERLTHDYHLSMEDGKVMVTQTDYRKTKPLATAELQLVNGEISGIANEG